MPETNETASPHRHKALSPAIQKLVHQGLAMAERKKAQEVFDRAQHYEEIANALYDDARRGFDEADRLDELVAENERLLDNSLSQLRQIDALIATQGALLGRIDGLQATIAELRSGKQKVSFGEKRHIGPREFWTNDIDEDAA